MEYYGICGIVLNFFHNYLRNRKQFVYFNGMSATVLPITYEVPQGSIVGPLLFIIYINDILAHLN